MLDFQTYCYLQNQKTGCTFVEEFLRNFSREPLLAYDKHAIVASREASKFYFINVREPLALYRSLFAYGVDGKGTVYLRLKALGHERLYARGPAGFSEWLRFVLDGRNALLLSNEYTPGVARLAGLMTWRFFRLSVAGYEAAAPGFTHRAEMNRFVKAGYFMNAVLKQESLRQGLATLAQRELASRLKNVDQALAWIEAAPPINVSESITQADEVAVDEDAMRLLFHKESQLYHNFYPNAPGYAQSKSQPLEDV